MPNYNVAMIEISKNPNLTEAQRQQAQQDYINRLPDSTLKQRDQQKRSLQTLMQRTQQLKTQGASDDELFAMRSELVGVPAAERLAAVDSQNEDFDQRFQQYQAAKNQILANVDNTADNHSQQAQIQQLQ